ncbi:MAG TPA: hypothetical protein VFC78_02845 [Tepidisphaeraceae bacterium]|nr:hypothetical protein [Tepidisphaeraceae bacterium]
MNNLFNNGNCHDAQEAAYRGATFADSDGRGRLRSRKLFPHQENRHEHPLRTDRSSKAEAFTVLKAFFDSKRVKCYPAREIRAAFGLQIPYFDVFALRDNAKPMLLRIRSATIQRQESWASTTHTYMDGAQMQDAADWAASMGNRFESVLAYVMKISRPGGPEPFEHSGQEYNIVGIRLVDFLRHMRPRAQRGSWQRKYDVSSGVFKEHAKALSTWLPA